MLIFLKNIHKKDGEKTSKRVLTFLPKQRAILRLKVVQKTF